MLYLGYLALACLVVVGALISVLSKNLLRSAVALGGGSAALSMLFFMLRAPYAGGFELSVGAGLIGVLFVVAISLTGVQEQQDEGP